MIEKMEFLSITGPKEDFDRVIDQYLSKYEIHLENALSELKTVKDLRPFSEQNPYKDILAKANEYLRYLPDEAGTSSSSISPDAARDIIRRLEYGIAEMLKQQYTVISEIEHVKNLRNSITPFKELHFNIKTIFNFVFIDYRFGKISLNHYNRLEHYLYDNVDSIFYKCYSDHEYVWGIYFVPSTLSSKVDAFYSSLHFEKIILPDEYDGTPEEAYHYLNERLKTLESQLMDLKNQMRDKMNDSKEDLLAAKNRLEALSNIFDVRKMAAYTKEDQVPFYILCGWMTQKDAKAFIREIELDENVYCINEEGEETTFQRPPTKLKNPFFFRPFEMFTRMYGLPCYDEMDPTIFIALTYALMFGAMFGDVGQGLLLVIGGFLIYKFKKSNLAAIISCSGIFSTIFGFLFGSVFGFEDIIEAVWIRPRISTVTLPFVGELNTVFAIAIGFGMFLTLLTMIFHIINAIKSKNLESLLFDANGFAGLVFYGSVITVVALAILQKPIPATMVLIFMFVIPLIFIALKEPLSKIVERKAGVMPKEKGMFVIQTFFEVFEILLSYFSNTLSFIRIGAFAVSHAAMMEVVLILAGAEAGGSPNWIVIVLGNLFVCGLEGLIVGIQVLRLEYYEMFSRFYKGTGREFVPYK